MESAIRMHDQIYSPKFKNSSKIQEDPNTIHILGNNKTKMWFVEAVFVLKNHFARSFKKEATSNRKIIKKSAKTPIWTKF